MKKFTIAVVETLSKMIEVEAEDFAEARKKVYNKWADGEIVLSADDYTGEVQFEYVDKKEINY